MNEFIEFLFSIHIFINRIFQSKQLELGDKMDLASYLLKPVQRMGKYALLLRQIIKVSSFNTKSHS